MRLRTLDLFSGIGGMALGLREFAEIIAYCEIEPFCQAVLLSRMESHELDTAPIWPDVTSLNREIFDTEIDLITGGFPCQDVSSANGNGRGLDGARSGLFFEIIRLANIYRPSYLFLENVSALIHRGIDRVALEFSKLGYSTAWTTISACEIGAPHVRKRVFILAYPASGTLRFPLDSPEAQKHQYIKSTEQRSPAFSRSNRERIKSRDIGIDARVPYQLDRLKALGNTLVPQVAEKAFCALIQAVATFGGSK